MWSQSRQKKKFCFRASMVDSVYQETVSVNICKLCRVVHLTTFQNKYYVRSSVIKKIGSCRKMRHLIYSWCHFFSQCDILLLMTLLFDCFFGIGTASLTFMICKLYESYGYLFVTVCWRPRGKVSKS